MKNIKLSFSLTEMPCYGIAHKGGRKTFEVQAFDGQISCDIQYDYARPPLRLNANVSENDLVEIILMPHRIELYINGVLADEEWPAGNRLFSIGDDINSPLVFCAEEYSEVKEETPSVISEFREAEGWRPEENVYVGDCMPYVKDGEYHVLYLKDRHHHKSKWGLGAHQWEHISTKNFSEWRVHPMAVPITEPSEGSICTGSWIRQKETEYLYYTIRKGRGQASPICRSSSSDGYHFKKDPDFGFTLPEIYNVSVARDPKVIKGDDGIYHMFLTTVLQDKAKGCLAHFVSLDLEQWSDTGTPIYISDDREQPECPDYIVYKGRYYLIYSLRGEAHYLISESPFTGWRKPKMPIIPCASVPKGAIWGDKIVFVGFRRIGGYGGTMTFRSATADENGELIFD